MRACRDQPFATLHRLVIGRADALSGCLAVLLAWDAPRQTFVRHLAELGVPTLVLVVMQPGETLDAPPVGGLVRIQRLEVGQLAEGLATL